MEEEETWMNLDGFGRWQEDGWKKTDDGGWAVEGRPGVRPHWSSFTIAFTVVIHFYASATTSSLNTPNNCPITPIMAMISLDNCPVTKTAPPRSATAKTPIGLGLLTICIEESAVLIRGLLRHFPILPVAIDASK
jgi:hypothetical protein